MNPMNSGNIPLAGMNINPAMLQKVGKVMRMVQTGTDVKSLITAFKKEGITPQVAEQALYVAFPKVKQIKQQIEQSGMTPQQFLQQVMQQNNISPEQLNQAMGGLGDMFRQ